MQGYIIKSFKNRLNLILERQETGTNSGGYVSANGLVVKRQNDFLCDGEWSIHSILRCERVDNQVPVGTIFTVGDQLTNNIHEFIGRGTIREIKIELSDPILIVGTGLNGDTGRLRLTNAQKYVEPVENTTKKKVGRSKKNPFEDIEIAILAQDTEDGSIRLEKTLKKSVTKLGVEGFLIKFFKEWNIEKNTIYAEDTTAIQTERNRRRSLGDIYRLCGYYFPNVELNEVIKLLYVTLPVKLKNQGFRTSYCSTIKKRVWYFSPSSGDLTANTELNDEYGHNWQYYIDNLK